jgi:hypothetical protein
MPVFWKLAVEAERDTLRAFVVGWGSGRGWDPVELAQRVLWPDEWHVRMESVRESVVEALRPGPHSFVLVRDDVRAALVAAFTPWETSLGLRLREQRRVQRASFRFEFTLHSRDEAAAVRRIFAELPDGVRVSDDYAPEEHSETGGTGGYAPAHAYTCRASGSVTGDLRDLLEVHARAHAHERIEAKPVELELGPAQTQA